MREEIVREFEMDVYTLLYFKWITNGDLLELDSMICDSQSEWEGSWGRMDTLLCMAESLHCSLKTITALFVN